MSVSDNKKCGFLCLDKQKSDCLESQRLFSFCHTNAKVEEDSSEDATRCISK